MAPAGKLLLQRQVAFPAAPCAKKRQYQDYEAQDSLDVDSMDELDSKLDKYADFIQRKDQPAGGTPARNGNGKGAPAQPAQQFRGPSSFASWDDDFTFDDWSQPLSPGSSGGYGGGSGGGGYMQNGGYMQDNKGYGNYGNYGGYGGGYGGAYIGGGNGGYMGNTYMPPQTNRRRNGRQLAFDDYDDYDDLEEERPVVKVDKCVINGKTLQANHGISVKEVFLLGAGPERTPLGVMPTSRAQQLAAEAKEDLLLINPDASPPVARIVDWSKYKYELEKGAKERKAKSTVVETKEVRLRPTTDSGDIAVKLKSCNKFLSKGDRVKLVMKFEGRELQFKEQGKEVLLEFISSLAGVAKVEGPLNFKSATYTIMLAPAK